MKAIELYFYIPRSEWPEDFPDDADSYWHGYRKGINCWTILTYLHLRAKGWRCRCGWNLPKEGIIVLHKDAVGGDSTTAESVLCVSEGGSRGVAWGGSAHRAIAQ